MKRYLATLILTFTLVLTGCTFSNTSSSQDSINHFFDAFQQEDYENMKSYCDENMMQYFNNIDGIEDFFGHKNAELINIEKIDTDQKMIKDYFYTATNNDYIVYRVAYKGEVAPYSSRTSNETIQLSFLLEFMNNEWKITAISSEY